MDKKQSKKTRKLAEQIARDVFTSGVNRHCDGLRLYQGPHYAGGWSERALVERIYKHLTGELEGKGDS